MVGVSADPGLARSTLRFAADEANRRRTDLLLVHACTPGWGLGGLEPVPPLEAGAEHGRSILRTATQRLLPLLETGRRVHWHLSNETAVDALVGQAAVAELVVIQRRDISTLGHLSTGSTSSKVAARAECPVAVVKPRLERTRAAGVVVGIDDADHAWPALLLAFREARLRRSPLTAVHVWSAEAVLTGYGWDPSVPALMTNLGERVQAGLSDVVARFTEEFPDVAVRQRLIDGPVVPGLLEAARTAELLVVGRHSRSRLGSFALGGVARACLDKAACPVLVTPMVRSTTSGPSALVRCRPAR